MKNIWLICNAHLDPVWLWEWEEGAAEALSTFRVAAELCEKFDGFIFNHNEAILYRWVEQYEPELFQKIQKLVKEGKWHIMGGWHLQPDCNIPSGEGFVRQALEGRKYFDEKFGVRPTTAINFDPFGHTRGLVQILSKCGYDSYLFCRPGSDFIDLPDTAFEWIGYDGSKITARRMNDSYNSQLGHAADKIVRCNENSDKSVVQEACLWGVGDHGGGPSKADLEQIAQLKETMLEQDVHLIHATPEQYFEAVRAEGKELPKHEGDLNLWAPGCYTSQIRIKQKYRKLENELFAVEKMCTAASIDGLMEYPVQELDAAVYDLLTAQFHDFLPGTSIRPAEAMAIRTLDHGLEILSRIKAQAFFALAHGQKTAESDEIPILVYNPHPFELEGDFECEMSLWDQNWEDNFSIPHVFDEYGNELPTQCEKEESNLNLDWRKHPVFHAKLPPMQMSRFNCKFEKIPKKPSASLANDDAYYIFRNEHICVKINRKTGAIDSYEIDGTEYLKKGAFTLNVVKDDADPWGMLVTDFNQKIGSFKLMDAEKASVVSGVKDVIDSIRIIEDGPVRTVVEVMLAYRNSCAVVHYKLPKTGTAIGLDVCIRWMEIQRMVKLSVPTALRNAGVIGQVAFGEEELLVTGRENVSQKYLIAVNSRKAVSVINDGIYGSSFKNNTFYLTLLRSAAYSAHPIAGRELLVQDRFIPHMDQGEREFSFVIDAGNAVEIRKKAVHAADAFAEKPMILSFFPSGGGKRQDGLFEISDETVEMTALKQARDGNGYIIRLFNSSDKAKTVKLINKIRNTTHKIRFGEYEVKTFRFSGHALKECNLIEE